MNSTEIKFHPLADITALRLHLRNAGFHPLPVEGKAPRLPGWQQKFDTNKDEIRLWSKTYHLAQNTGVLAKFTPGIDIDITTEDAAEAVEALAREFFEEHGDIYVRFGKPPKRLIPLRTDEPFTKLSRVFISPNGTEQKIEILCDGQQYVVDGVHPETRQPYLWHGDGLRAIKREDLPYARREDIERFLDAAAKLLAEEFGFVERGGNGDAHALPHVDDAPKVAPAGDGPTTPCSFAEEARLRSALSFISTNEKVLTKKFGSSHKAWFKIGMAIERLDWGEKGFAIWRDWSAQNAKEFDERGLRTQWASFQRNRNTTSNAVTVGTVYHYAKLFGWSEPQHDQQCEKELPKLQWLDMSNWDHEPVPERKWAIFNRVPLKQVGLVSGEGGAGKSIVELTKHGAHVAGKDWFGSMPERGPTIYIGAEDEEDEIHIRLAAIAKHYGVTFDELIAGGLHVLCLLGQDATLCAATGKSGRVEITDLYRQLYEAAGDIKPINISIDTLSRAFAGNEIDRVQVYAFAMHMQALALVAQGSVTVLSHPSLQGIATGTGLSGSTAWHGAFRFRQYLKGVKAEGGEQPDQDLRELEFKKNQYGPTAETITLRYQNGLFLPLPGVSFAQAARDAKADEVFLDLLARFTEQNRYVSHKTGANYAPALFAKEDIAKAAGLTSHSLAGAMRRLFASGKICNEPCGKPSRPQYRIAVKS
jgi:RecA-family ATPase